MSIDTEFFGGQAVKWVSGTTYPIDFIVRSTISPHNYVKITSSVGGATDPSGDETNWRRLGAGAIKSTATYQDAMGSGATNKITTIAAVSDRAIVIPGGYNSGFTYAVGDGTGCYITRSGSTQVTASRVNTNAPCYYSFIVVDYW